MIKREQNTTRHLPTILLIVLVALLLRLVFYMGILRGDDFAYALYAYKFSIGELSLDTYYAGINRMGLYVPAGILFSLLGINEFVATLFPLLASCATVFFVYRIASLLGGSKAGLVSALLWAVFPLDIFMATQLDPEGPLAMASSATVYFFLRFLRAASLRERLAHLLGSSLFFVWALYIKLSVLPLIFVLILFFFFEFAGEVKEKLYRFSGLIDGRRRIIWGAAIAVTLLLLVSRQNLPVAINNLELTATDVYGSFYGRANTIHMQDIGGGYWQTNREVYTPPVSRDMLAELAVERVKIFDAFFLLLLVSTVFFLFSRERGPKYVLIWFFFLIAYIEFGPFPRSLSAILQLQYVPVTHWIALDNLLYICVPLVIQISIYLSRKIETESFLLVSIKAASIFVAIVALLLIFAPTKDFALSVVSSSLVATIFLSFMSPFLVGSYGVWFSNSSRMHGLLLILITVAALNPSIHYHSWDFYKEQRLRGNLREAITYLDLNSGIPIFAGGLASRLGVYANFRYGSTLMKDELNLPQSRFTDSQEVIKEMGGYYVNAGCRKPLSSLQDWPVATFGDPQTAECVSVSLVVPDELAKARLATSKNAVSPSNLRSQTEYLSAAAASQEMDEFVSALAYMATYFPQQLPLIEASGILGQYAMQSGRHSMEDLLGQMVACPSCIEFGQTLEFREAEAGSNSALIFAAIGEVAQSEAISVTLELKPSTAYVLEFDLRSTILFSLGFFPDEEIVVSRYPDWQRATEWSRQQVFFVTPNVFSDGNEVKIDLARVYDYGEIWFREIKLTEIQTD